MRVLARRVVIVVLVPILTPNHLLIAARAVWDIDHRLASDRELTSTVPKYRPLSLQSGFIFDPLKIP